MLPVLAHPVWSGGVVPILNEKVKVKGCTKWYIKGRNSLHLQLLG